MDRLLAPLTLALLLLTPSLALADVAPARGCNRCGVDEQVSQGTAVFALVGFVGLLALRRRNARD